MRASAAARTVASVGHHDHHRHRGHQAGFRAGFWPPHALRGERPRRAANLALALAFTVFVILISSHIDSQGDSLDAFGYGLMVVAGGSIATRWRWPLPSLLVSAAAVGLYAGFDYKGGPVYVAPLFALFAVASVYDRRRALLLAVGLTGAITVTGAIAGDDWNVAQLLYPSWAAGIVFIADAARNRRAYFDGLAERAKRMEETREEEARRRVAEERLRIARDLHDVVAHSIASINVQSGVAAHVIDQHPERAKEALLAIKQASREALDELRATLGLLRQGDDVAPRVPAPSLKHLDSLVATASGSGVSVDVEITGRPTGIEPGISPATDAAAFRIVQESLTNVVRHAGAAHARVTISYGPDAVDIDVVDDGRGVPDGNGSTSGAGHGLAGMRERAAGVGGSVETGPRLGGGFRVHAHLPYAAVSA